MSAEPEVRQARAEARRRRQRRWRRAGVVIGVVGGLLIALLIVAIVIGSTHVTFYTDQSAAMLPTLKTGARFAARTRGFGLRLGEIVVLHPPAGAASDTPHCGVPGEGIGSARPCGAATPAESSMTLVKRIVAGPGDRVALDNGRVILNGVPQTEPYARPCDEAGVCNFPRAVLIPPGDYFVLGDNRGVSDDSRFWGPVPAAWIVGQVVHCSFFVFGCSPLR